LLLAVSLVSAVSIYTVKSGVSENIGCAFTDILTEGFEGGVMPPPGGWTVDNENPNEPWEIVSKDEIPQAVHSGQYAAINWWNASRHSDNWLISPKLDLTGYSKINLEFWMIADLVFTGATIELHIMGDGFDDIIWNLVEDENWENGIYQKRTFDLTSYKGEEAKIAWRYVGKNGPTVALDDIIVSGTQGGGNNPPYEPNTPNPIDGAVNVSINTDLSWTGGDPDGDPVTYDVYFGTSSPPPKVVSNQLETTYDPDTMNFNITYYWKIVAWDNHGESTTSPIWHFITRGEPTEPPWQAIFYFNDYDGSEAWTFHPECMANHNLENWDFALTYRENVEHLTGNSYSGCYIGDIKKVELRAYGRLIFGPELIILRPVFSGVNDGDNHIFTPDTSADWSEWFDITYDTNAPSDWSWEDIENLDCDVEAQILEIPAHFHIFSVEIRVSRTNPPDLPSISGLVWGIAGIEYEYTFVSTDPDDDDICYFVDWGDNTFEEWSSPYSSGEEIVKSHIWEQGGKFTIRAKARDIYGAESDWGYLDVTMPVNQDTSADMSAVSTQKRSTKQLEVLNK